MKQIEKDELFENLRGFLRSKGINLTEGSYSQTVQKSCRILADVINMGQQGIERAKTGINQKLDQVRECIHHKTAPKPPRMPRNGKAAEPPVTPEPEPAGNAGDVPPPMGGEPGEEAVSAAEQQAKRPSKRSRKSVLPRKTRKPKKA
jgi:hypothetical protein